MKAEDRYRLLGDIAGLTVFAGLKTHPLIEALAKLLKVLDSKGIPEKEFPLELSGAWAAFTGALLSYQGDGSFYTALAALTLADENPFTLAAQGRNGPASPVLLTVTRTDLSRLERIARLDVSALGFYIASLLRDRGLEDAALACEETARALWRAEGTGAGALAELFPENSAWSEALPKLQDHISASG